MKKLYFIIGIAVVMMTSCSRQKTISEIDNEINREYNEPTRSDTVDLRTIMTQRPAKLGEHEYILHEYGKPNERGYFAIPEHMLTCKKCCQVFD